MKKFFKILLWIISIIYFLIVILISILVIKENEYGITTFGNNYYVIINENSENDVYKNGDLVIVENKKIDELKESEEVFLYKSNSNNEVNIKIGKIKDINLESNPKYIIVDNDIGFYREDSILGIYKNQYNNIGKIINFLEKKWIFLFLLIVPTIVILIFELFFIIKKLKRREENINN